MVVTDQNIKRRIAIVGGGISGLTAAFHLQQSAPHIDYDVFEAQPRWGGVLHTTRKRGFLIENSADSYLDTPEQPWATQLATDLRLGDQLIAPNVEFRRAKILFRGRLHDVPAGFYLTTTTEWKPLFRSKLLSWSGKLRLACESLIPQKNDERDESLREFAVRRVGREVYERLVQPLVSGIYSADPERLSVAAALPRLVEWEQNFGSLTAGLRADRLAEQAHRDRTLRDTEDAGSGARYARFRTLRGGMGTWIEALVHGLRPASLHPSHCVLALQHGQGAAWSLSIVDPQSRAHNLEYDGIVLATPHWSTAAIVESVAPKLARALRQISSASIAIVSVGMHRHQLSIQPDCFGIVVPLIEQRNMIAVSFSSIKFPGRAPAEQELVRVFVGGACQSELLDHDDAALEQLVMHELQNVLGMTGQPLCTHVSRWMHLTPQYELGHAQRLQAIQSHLDSMPAVAITGNAFHGIGIPQCIRQAQQNTDLVRAAVQPRSS